MRDNDKEALSALMDGEASELEVRAAIRNAARDPALAETWSRYHLASAVMRRQLPPGASRSLVGIDLAARIARDIEEDPVPGDVAADAPASPEATSTAAGATAGRFWQALRGVGNVAIAASVAAAVVTGWELARPGLQTPGALGQATASLQSALPASNVMPVDYSAASTPPAVGYGRSLPVAQTVLVSSSPAADERFNRYLISHSGNAALATQGGPVSYVRVVTLKPVGADGR